MTSRSLQNAFFLSLLLLTTAAFFGLIQAFLQPIFWAAVLATIFHPLYAWCERRLGGYSNVASVATIFIILLVVIAPLGLTGSAVASEASVLYDRIATGELDPQSVIAWIERHLPVATDLLAQVGLSPDELRAELSTAAVSASRYLATEAVNIGQNAIRVGGLTFLMLYLLFFFLRDGTALLDVIVGAVPIGDARERHLLNKFAEVSRATLKGTLVIGIVQGGLGGLLFGLLGIDAAILWGVVMGILSLLPAVGAAVVWVPAAAILIFTGEAVKGIILLVGGSVLIGLADNVLRPLLVGRDTQMPDYLILVSTLGGLTVFGLSGVVIGPVIAALFLAVWDMFVEEYSTAASDGGLLSDASSSPSSTAQASSE
jgi:predicted PurR-regulated permease PerM